MKTPLRRHPAAFTLIELMAVITIIILLAGLVVGGMGFVNDRQAKEKSRTQIALLSKALEEYRLDMGVYPMPTQTSSSSQQVRDGTGNTALLYRVLYSDGAAANSATRVYLAELDPSNKQGWLSGTRIVDPWGNEYRYRCSQKARSGSATEPNPHAQNPDFDLWSCGKDGRHNTSYTTGGNMNHADNRDDIRNF